MNETLPCPTCDARGKISITDYVYCRILAKDIACPVCTGSGLVKRREGEALVCK